MHEFDGELAQSTKLGGLLDSPLEQSSRVLDPS